MKAHNNKTKTKRIWFDTRIRLWTLQNLDNQQNQIDNVEYEVNRKKAYEWLEEEKEIAEARKFSQFLIKTSK